MKYKNPRLKHVKKIEKIISQLWIDTKDLKEIERRCNLLLETKKRKCDHYCHTMNGDGWCSKCKTKHPGKKYDRPTLPSPQPEIETFSTFEIEDMADEALALKLNLVIDQVNKLTKTK